jgi:hypothetical protein
MLAFRNGNDFFSSDMNSSQRRSVREEGRGIITLCGAFPSLDSTVLGALSLTRRGAAVRPGLDSLCRGRNPDLDAPVPKHLGSAWDVGLVVQGAVVGSKYLYARQCKTVGMRGVDLGKEVKRVPMPLPLP